MTRNCRDSWASPSFYKMHLVVLDQVIAHPPQITPYSVYLNLLERVKEIKVFHSPENDFLTLDQLKTLTPASVLYILRRYHALGFLKKKVLQNELSPTKHTEAYSLNKDRVIVIKSGKIKHSALLFLDDTKEGKTTVTLFANGTTSSLNKKLLKQISCAFA